MRLVIKIGGNEIDSPDFLSAISTIIKDLQKKHEVIIVHGAGKEISALHEKLAVNFETINGLRKTSPQSMRIVEMVLRGAVNTRLVKTFVNSGIEAIGVSGVDLGLLTAETFNPELQRVGRVVSIKKAVLEGFLQQEYLPIVAASVALGTDGETLNVNADDAAAAIAAELKADFLVMVSNVPGVIQDQKIIDKLDIQSSRSLIASGVISGGMIPKVEAAFSALQKGVKQILICNLAGLLEQQGTVFVK